MASDSREGRITPAPSSPDGLDLTARRQPPPTRPAGLPTYLTWASAELGAQGRTKLDPRWVISPTGGLDKVASFIALFAGNKLHVAVLADFHTGDKKKVRDLRDSELLKSGHVFTADTIAGQAEADTEDLLGRANYVALVNDTYGLTGVQRLSAAKPTGAPIRVVAEVGDHSDDTRRAFLHEWFSELRMEADGAVTMVPREPYRAIVYASVGGMVGAAGIEPATSRM